MDALQLIREMYEEDPDDEDSDEQGSTEPSSPTMKPSEPCQVHVGHCAPMDAIESMREMFQKIDPVDQIDPLVCFIESELQKMNDPSEAGSSSSEVWLETVRQGTKLAAMAIETISTEAEKLSISDDAVEAMRSLTLKVVKGMGELHSVFIGLSIAAFALESYMRVSSIENECTQLLLKILELAQNVKQYREQMQERGKLCHAVATIVAGALFCCDHLTRGKTFRFWSAATAAAQLEKTNQQLRDIRDCFGLSSLQQVQQLLDFQWRKYYGGDRDVFLSHSGKQKNFVRQLHKDLTREHVSCFLDEDDECLPLAQKFPDLIFKHAETCKIALLVLSKDFICSKWPMLELSAFIRAMNSGKNANLRLFPIFFMTSPKELRITKGSPEWGNWEASEDIKGEWQAALKVVRSINGLNFSKDGNEVVFRDIVVQKICGILRQINPESPIQLFDFMPVGIKEAQNTVIQLLDVKNPSRRMVVIYGVGGIGKTTLATAVVSTLDLTGYHYCRVDMDQDCKFTDLQAMQEQILRNIFKQDLKLNSCTHGRERLKEAFGRASNRPVFLFIDNVLRKKDLEMLLPIEQLSHLPKQSRILLTTRSLNETKMVGLQDGIQVYCHRVDSLSNPDAKSLLCHYALGDKNGSFDPGVNVEGLVEFCGGIPLVLRIVGSHLRNDGESVSACNEILEYLKKWQQKGFEGGEEDLSECIVDFVYRRLKEHSKEAFLDIVFFFHEWERSEVSDIVGEMELRDLEGAALVTTFEEDKDRWEMGYMVKKTVVKVKMHDIVRARGTKLSQGNRITDSESLGILLRDEHQKLQQTKGIWLPSDDKEISLEAEHIDLMSRSLRVLSLGYRMRLNGLCHRAFEDLRFLGISFEDMLPIDLTKSSQLVYFRGKLMKGQGISKLPKSLRLLYLDGYASDPPVSFDMDGHLISLKELKLDFFTIEKLDAIGNFSCLKKLKLRDIMLERLPECFGNLYSLQTLDLSYCSKLEGLSDSFGNLSSMQCLSMSNCSKLEKLPESFGNLSSMQYLYLNCCFKLEGLPESFGNLTSLKTLVMTCCNKICTLCDKFVKLKCLEFLSISHCKGLKRLPDDIVFLTSLVSIRAYGCAELEAKAMDCLVEIKSLLFLEMGESPMLIKRWEEIQQNRPLIGAAVLMKYMIYPYREIMSTTFFNCASTFLHVDGKGQLAEVASCSFPEVGVKVALFFTACDLSNEVRQKLVEVASQQFQIIYVDVAVERDGSSWMEEREKRIRETLIQLPEGSRAWTSCFRKTTLLFAYSLWLYTDKVDTSIVGTSVVVDDKGRRKVSLPLEKIFRSDVSESRRVNLTTLLSPLDNAWRGVYSL